MINTHFRKANMDEGRILTDLAMRSKAYWPYSPAYLEKCRLPLTVDEAYIAQWPVFILEVDQKIAGFYSFFKKDEKAWLDNLWLDPSVIGAGLGRKLFTHAVTTAHELRWMPFYIAGDPLALKFYLKMGCHQVGFEKSQVLDHLYLPLLEFSAEQFQKINLR